MDITGIANQNVFDSALMQSSNPLVPANGPGADFAERLRAAYGMVSMDRSGDSQPLAPSPQPLGKDPEIDRDSKLFEMCRELETFLLKNLITSMRNTVQKSGFMDTGFAGKFYEDMLYDEYAKSFAQNAGFGFAEMAYKELYRKARSEELTGNS